MNHLSLIPEEKSITIKIDKKINIIPVSGSRNARIEGTKTIKKDFKITFNSLDGDKYTFKLGQLEKNYHKYFNKFTWLKISNSRYFKPTFCAI